MKSTLITNIEKTRNSVCKTIDGVPTWIPLNDFFYSNKAFIGSKIEIEFTTSDIVSNFRSPFWNLEKIIRDIIVSKKEELGRSNYIELSYKIIDTKMDNDSLKLIVEVTRCEYDCS